MERRAAIVAFTAIVVVAASRLYAAEGDLDQSFGGTGIVAAPPLK